jgi:streptogramin lyase
MRIGGSPTSNRGARGGQRTLSARYGGRCARCGTQIRKGDQIVEVPGWSHATETWEREYGPYVPGENVVKPPLRWRHADCPAAFAQRNSEGCLASVGLAVLLVAAAITGSGCASPAVPATPRAVNVVVATIPLSGQPLAVAFAPDGTPWVGCGGSPNEAIEIDPATNSTKREVPTEVGIDATSGSGALWFGSSSGLTRVDPLAAQVTATIPTGSQANAVAFGEGAIWTTDYLANTLLRVDPATNTITARIGVVAFPGMIAVGGGKVWVAGFGGDVIDRVDPSTGQVDGTVADLHGLQDLVFANNALYAVGWDVEGSEGDWVARVDPVNLVVLASAAISDVGDRIAFGDGAVWVTLANQNLVARVDPKTLATTASIPVGGAPQGLGTSPGAVWVAVSQPPSVVRIATGG